MEPSPRIAGFPLNKQNLGILYALALLLAVWIATWPVTLPGAAPASAPATQFSAGRALEDLKVIAAEPHGAGSPAQARVREYIIAQANALGLEAEVQTSEPVSNILVRLPGSANTKAVLITGHYDSHPPAPGAGDDGVTIAAMLETMRVPNPARR